jgi:hypothetical protein
MQVNDPYAMLLDKFKNLCDHLEKQYPSMDVASLRAVPGPVLLSMVRKHLVPRKELLWTSTSLKELEPLIEDVNFKAMAAQCSQDTKVKRYLQLFCELCQD